MCRGVKEICQDNSENSLCRSGVFATNSARGRKQRENERFSQVVDGEWLSRLIGFSSLPPNVQNRTNVWQIGHQYAANCPPTCVILQRKMTQIAHQYAASYIQKSNLIAPNSCFPVSESTFSGHPALQNAEKHEVHFVKIIHNNIHKDKGCGGTAPPHP